MKLSIDIARKRFESTATTALESFRLTTQPGEFIAITGVSGAGKSTLLQIVAGLDEEYDGQVTLDGTAPEAGRNDVAYVFQQPRLMPWLTARENLTLVVDETDSRQLEAVDECLDAMGLGEFAHAYPGQLSGGMQRRVSLARAFVRRPKLLLLDEPFVSLDLDTAERLRSLLLDLWKASDATVLFVTHDLPEALALADRLVVFTPPPGRVAEVFQFDLPRPRDPDAHEFNDVRARLRPLLTREHDKSSATLPEERPSAVNA